MPSPLVSILIPAHNAGKWLAETLDCALAQTWPRKEIIVVDDGSTDHTPAVARAYESETVQVIGQENRGACHARNRALAEAQGDYIQWLDADDLLDPRKIDLQLQGHPDTDRETTFTSAWGRFFYLPRRARFTPTRLWQTLDAADWLVTRFAYPGMMPNHCWLVSREVTRKAGAWDARLRRNQDGEYFTRVAAASKTIQFVRQARAYYRRAGAGSISARKSAAAVESDYLAACLCVEHVLRVEDTERSRQACKTWFENLVAAQASPRQDVLARSTARLQQLGLEVDVENVVKGMGAPTSFPLRVTRAARDWSWRRRLDAARSWDYLLYLREHSHRIRTTSGRTGRP